MVTRRSRHLGSLTADNVLFLNTHGQLPTGMTIKSDHLLIQIGDVIQKKREFD